MKTFIIALVMFFSVAVFITVNFFILDSLLDYSLETLENIPERISEVENLSEKEREKISANLDKLEKKWRNNETFLCMCMRHEKSRDFILEIICAKAYLESSEYADFVANIGKAKYSISHMKYDEGVKIGNLM